jgi:hypothetical protein
MGFRRFIHTGLNSIIIIIVNKLFRYDISLKNDALPIPQFGAILIRKRIFPPVIQQGLSQ